MKAKVRMLGGSDKFIPEMEKCGRIEWRIEIIMLMLIIIELKGMPRSSIPSIFGGTFPSVSLLSLLEQYVNESKEEKDQTNVGDC